MAMATKEQLSITATIQERVQSNPIGLLFRPQNLRPLFAAATGPMIWSA